MATTFSLLHVCLMLMAHFCMINSLSVLTIAPNHCPSNCSCDTDEYSLSCLFPMRPQRADVIELQNYFSVHRVSSFTVHAALLDLYSFRDISMTGLRTFDASDNLFQVLNDDSFTQFDNLQILDLSENYLDNLNTNAFHGLSDTLLALNLSSNLLSRIPAEVFQDLSKLELLDLSNNRLQSLPVSIFDDLTDLETLDLSFNQLSFLSSRHFTKLSKLQTLFLHNNIFRTFHMDVMPSLSNIPNLDLSFNPYDCSCAISSLVEMVKSISSESNGTGNHLVNSDDTSCQSPDIYQGRLLQDVDEVNLNCTHPRIANISEDQSALHLSDLYLTCGVVGYPDPAVVWFTPWGDVFSHHTFKHLIGDQAVHHHVQYSYLGQKIFITSDVSALPDGSLQIKPFRGFFAGNFTCFAMTPIGNVSETFNVAVFTPFMRIYVESLIYGGMSAAGFALLGAIVGAILTIIRRCCCPDFFKVEEEKIKTPDVVVEVSVVSDVESSSHSDQKKNDDDDDDHESPPPDTPLTCDSNDNSSCDSPMSQNKFSESPPQGWLSSNMIETFGEVRSKLKYGVERKMETVRTHTKAIKDSSAKKIETVQRTVKTIKEGSEKKIETIRTNVKSMKDSGTVYMQSIKDTSSHAAHKVRAGVVMSVETMKYTVQSMKEMCGTGEMGGGTISMMSMETDIDSNESKQVYKSVTYV